MEQGLLLNYRSWMCCQPALVAVTMCSIGQPSLRLELEGRQLGGWDEEHYQWPGRWQKEVGGQDVE